MLLYLTEHIVVLVEYLNDRAIAVLNHAAYLRTYFCDLDGEKHQIRNYDLSALYEETTCTHQIQSKSSPNNGSFTLHGTGNGNGMGNGTGNNGFMYFAMYCSHYTGTGTGDREQGTGTGTIGFHTHFPIPIPIPVPVPSVIIGKTLPFFSSPGFSHLKNFKIKPSPGFLKSIFLVKCGTLPLRGKTLPINIVILY